MNFEKPLQDATDEELMRWVNQHNYQVVPLASDELTRRTLKNLQEEIKKFNKSTEKSNKVLIALTLTLLVVGVVQIVLSIFLSKINLWVGVGIEVLALSLIAYSFNRILKDFFGKEKKGKRKQKPK